MFLESSFVAEQHTRPLWKELYEICWSFYVKNHWNADKFKEIIRDVQKSDDPQLIRFLLWFNDARTRTNFNNRFEWLTSFHRGRRYPPLRSDLEVREPWNNLSELDNLVRYGNEPISLYKFDSLVTESFEKITQNVKVNDCSLVCSLINAREKGQLHYYYSKDIMNITFYFNGCSRLVSVFSNSSFPKLTHDGSILTLYSNKIEDKLIELAYFEIKNDRDYNYNGSNTAADTYLITGWIPEIFDIRSTTPEDLRKLVDTDNSMLAIGSEATTNANIPGFHDFVISSIDWDDNSIDISNPHTSEPPVSYTWTELLHKFKWLYVNWNPSAKYTTHKRLHDRYLESFNKYPTWTQKPLIKVTNNSSFIQACHLFLERHLYDKDPPNSDLILGELPRSGFTTVEARGNNTGFYNIELTLEPNETRTFFYHSDTKCNLTFHLLANSDNVVISKTKSDITTIESSWNITNNSYPIESSELFKNPAFKLNVNGSDDIFLDLELVSQHLAKVNFEVFETMDYAFQKPLSRNKHYAPQICSESSLRLIPGIEYYVLCSLEYPVETPFILTLRGSSPEYKFNITPYSLAFGGLRYNKSVHFKQKLIIDIQNFTKTYFIIYQSNFAASQKLPTPQLHRIQLYDSETKTIIHDNTVQSHDLSLNPYVLPNIELRPSIYTLEVDCNNSVLTANVGSSHKIDIQSSITGNGL